MWSSRLFWKIFVSYAALNLVATVIFVIIVTGWQQDQVVQQLKHRLHASASLVRTVVSDELPQGSTQALKTEFNSSPTKSTRGSRWCRWTVGCWLILGRSRLPTSRIWRITRIGWN